MLNGCMWIVLAVFLSFPVFSQDAEHVESLDKALRAFHEGLQKGTVEERRAALKAMLPTRDDIAALFPDDVDVLWPPMESFFAQMLEHVDDVAEEVGDDPITRIELIDVRQDHQWNEDYEAVFAMLPKPVPAYRAAITRGERTGGSSTYIFVNGHWFHFMGFESIPEMIVKLRAQAEAP